MTRCRLCNRRMLPAARKGGVWGHPGTHARCALAAKDHPLERGFNWKLPTGWQDDEPPEAWTKNAPVTWWSWGDVYLHWRQVSPPWSVTNWWWFRFGRYCDGMRRSTLVQVPFLGSVVYFHNRPCGHNSPDGA